MKKPFPYISISLLFIIAVGCIFADVIIAKDPSYMALDFLNNAPGKSFLFGTDSLGRDIFSIILYGGRISLIVGLSSTLISSIIGIFYGAISAMAKPWLDDILMRFTEILMSIPQILLVIFIQISFGEPSVLSISLVIGATSWMGIAKMVRSEVLQIRKTDYVLAAKSMGGNFFYILWNHLMPNFMSTIMYMIITNVAAAIAMEATLSFLGFGMSSEIVTWGGLMSLSKDALVTGSWWIILIPGIFLLTTIISITEIGEYLRNRNRRDKLV